MKDFRGKAKAKADLLRRLEQCLQREENQICAECPEPNPTWASLLIPPISHEPDEELTKKEKKKKKKEEKNIQKEKKVKAKRKMGVFCCYKCCSYHFQMGRKVCEVKNIKVAEEWSSDEVKAMELSGNGVVNTIYEARMDPEQKNFKAKDKWEEQSLRSDFVKRKYQDLQFFNPNAYKGQMKLREDPEYERMLIMSLNLLGEKTTGSSQQQAENEEPENYSNAIQNARNRSSDPNLLAAATAGRRRASMTGCNSDFIRNLKDKNRRSTGDLTDLANESDSGDDEDEEEKNSNGTKSKYNFAYPMSFGTAKKEPATNSDNAASVAATVPDKADLGYGNEEYGLGYGVATPTEQNDGGNVAQELARRAMVSRRNSLGMRQQRAQHTTPAKTTAEDLGYGDATPDTNDGVAQALARRAMGRRNTMGARNNQNNNNNNMGGGGRKGVARVASNGRSRRQARNRSMGYVNNNDSDDDDDDEEEGRKASRSPIRQRKKLRHRSMSHLSSDNSDGEDDNDAKPARSPMRQRKLRNRSLSHVNADSSDDDDDDNNKNDAKPAKSPTRPRSLRHRSISHGSAHSTDVKPPKRQSLEQKLSQDSKTQMGADNSDEDDANTGVKPATVATAGDILSPNPKSQGTANSDVKSPAGQGIKDAAKWWAEAQDVYQELGLLAGTPKASTQGDKVSQDSMGPLQLGIEDSDSDGDEEVELAQPKRRSSHARKPRPHSMSDLNAESSDDGSDAEAGKGSKHQRKPRPHSMSDLNADSSDEEDGAKQLKGSTHKRKNKRASLASLRAARSIDIAVDNKTVDIDTETVDDYDRDVKQTSTHRRNLTSRGRSMSYAAKDSGEGGLSSGGSSHLRKLHSTGDDGEGRKSKQVRSEVESGDDDKQKARGGRRKLTERAKSTSNLGPDGASNKKKSLPKKSSSMDKDKAKERLGDPKRFFDPSKMSLPARISRNRSAGTVQDAVNDALKGALKDAVEDTEEDAQKEHASRRKLTERAKSSSQLGPDSFPKKSSLPRRSSSLDKDKAKEILGEPISRVSMPPRVTRNRSAGTVQDAVMDAMKEAMQDDVSQKESGSRRKLVERTKSASHDTETKKKSIPRRSSSLDKNKAKEILGDHKQLSDPDLLSKAAMPARIKSRNRSTGSLKDAARDSEVVEGDKDSALNRRFGSARKGSKPELDAKGSSHSRSESRRSSRRELDAKGSSHGTSENRRSSRRELDARGSSHSRRVSRRELDAKGSSHGSRRASRQELDGNGSSHSPKRSSSRKRSSSKQELDANGSSHSTKKSSSKQELDANGSSHSTKRSSKRELDGNGSSHSTKRSSKREPDANASSRNKRSNDEEGLSGGGSRHGSSDSKHRSRSGSCSRIQRKPRQSTSRPSRTSSSKDPKEDTTESGEPKLRRQRSGSCPVSPRRSSSKRGTTRRASSKDLTEDDKACPRSPSRRSSRRGMPRTPSTSPRPTRQRRSERSSAGSSSTKKDPIEDSTDSTAETSATTRSKSPRPSERRERSRGEKASAKTSDEDQKQKRSKSPMRRQQSCESCGSCGAPRQPAAEMSDNAVAFALAKAKAAQMAKEQQGPALSVEDLEKKSEEEEAEPDSFTNVMSSFEEGVKNAASWMGSFVV